MPGEVISSFNKKYESAISDLEIKKLYLSEINQQLTLAEKKIERAIEQIQKSYLSSEQKNQLIKAIERLDLILTSESSESIMLTKYQALATMLDTVIVSNYHDATMKAEALDAYLMVFKEPSSRTKTKSTLCMMIGVFALVVGLCVAAHFLLPLIPFTAALAWMGLSGGWLAFGTSVLATATQIGSMLLSCWVFCAIAEKLIDPLNEIIQSYTEEYKVADSIKKDIGSSLSFFTVAKAAPQPPIEREQEDVVESGYCPVK